MSLREKIARMVAAWTYSGPPWSDKDWDIATGRADQILAAIEREQKDASAVVEAARALLDATIEDCGDPDDSPNYVGGVALNDDGESAVTFEQIHALKAALKRYMACEKTGNGSRIYTHCLYPSFESVPVYIIGHGNGYIVHDGATASGVAWTHGRDKEIILKAIAKAARQFGVSAKAGQISAKVESAEWIESAILAVANASSMAAHTAVEQYVKVTEVHNVRADERERLAKIAEGNHPGLQVLRALTPRLSWAEIAQFIRSQGEE